MCWNYIMWLYDRPDITSHDPHDLTDWSSNISTGTDTRPHSSLQWQPCVHLDDITLASVSPEAESGSSWGNIPLPWHWHMALHCRHVQYVDIRSDQSWKYRRHVSHIAAMTAVMICPWENSFLHHHVNISSKLRKQYSRYFFLYSGPFHNRR